MALILVAVALSARDTKKRCTRGRIMLKGSWNKERYLGSALDNRNHEGFTPKLHQLSMYTDRIDIVGPQDPRLCPPQLTAVSVMLSRSLTHSLRKVLACQIRPHIQTGTRYPRPIKLMERRQAVSDSSVKIIKRNLCHSTHTPLPGVRPVY